MEFGFKLMQEDWGSFNDDMDVDMMLEAFETQNQRMVDSVFPEKLIQVGPDEKPYFTEELRHLKRRRQRAYARHGRRSQQYTTIKQSFDYKLKHEAHKYVQKIQQEVREGKRGSGCKAIRKLGNRPSESWNQPQINIQSYIEQNLTPKEAADKLGDYFSAISRPLLKRYPYEYAAPLARIFNKMIKSGTWPRKWVKEEAICLSKLEKSKTPASEDDLRTNAKTAWASKLCENLLGDFILPVIDSLLDPGQCGGLKKSSISHYLVKLLDFAHTTLDMRSPHAAVL